MSKQWAAARQKEQSKLAPKEADWNLAGLGASLPDTRTRITPKKRQYFGDSSSSSSSSDSAFVEEPEFLSGSSSDEEEMEAWNDVKPPATRLIVENAPLKELVERNAKCPKCGSSTELICDTVTMATATRIECKDSKCTCIDYGRSPAPCTLPQFEDNRDRNTDCAANVLYVLGTICNGNGGTEAARLLGLLGLPNDTTVESRSFPTIEERIAPVTKQLHDDIIMENLAEEVSRSVEDPNQVLLWKESLKPESPVVLEKANYPEVSGSFDTGWNQRGQLYNSPSSHSFLVGKFIRKPIGGRIYSKLCAFCSAWKKAHSDDNPMPATPEHCCLKNHEGTSGSMEPRACVDIVTRLHDESHVNVKMICMDDDASTRSALQWNNADYLKNNNATVLPPVLITKGINKGKEQPRPDKGKLKGYIKEPQCCSDPNHRKKILTGDLHAVATKKKSENFTMTKMDMNRIGKNFGYMTRSLPTTEESLYLKCGKAVLNHHFDDHTDCGNWCPRKRLSAQAREGSNRFYRCKKKDAKLYEILSEILARFITLERLKEVAHGMDTNINESLNNTISYFAPKNRVFCSTRSLENRVAIAIGIQSLGFLPYFRRLFKALGIQVTTNVLHWLEVKHKKRERHLQRAKLTEKKKRRMQKKFEVWKEQEALAKKERSKRDGTYKRGGNLHGFDDDEGNNRKARNKRRKQGPIICPLCKKKGHKTIKSKKCKYNPQNPEYDPAVPVPEPIAAASTLTQEEEKALLDAADAEAMDTLPLDGDNLIDGDIKDEFAEFQDAGTWSEDEDGNIHPVGAL